MYRLLEFNSSSEIYIYIYIESSCILTDNIILAILSSVTRQAVTLDMTRSTDLTALLVVVARTGVARAQVANRSVVRIPVIAARAGFTRSARVTSWASASFNLRCSPIPSEVLDGSVHADITDVRRGHVLAVGSAYQNSLQIGEHDHEIRPGSAARSFGG